MTTMLLLGYGCALLIGLILGLMGGGGSLLTIPILVYMLNISPSAATAYSLFVVGATSFVGAVRYSRKQQVRYRVALLFSAPSFITIYLTRRYILPAIPDPVLGGESVYVSKAAALMLLFAGSMLVAAVLMIADRKNQDADQTATLPHKAALSILAGVFVGGLTGLTGIGGGFVIVPTLVLLARLPMKSAVGTSLLIIAINALSGFVGDTSSGQIDWPFLLAFTALAIAGILAGSQLSSVVPAARLRRSFGWFLLGISVCIMVKEAPVPLVEGINRLSAWLSLPYATYHRHTTNAHAPPLRRYIHGVGREPGQTVALHQSAGGGSAHQRHPHYFYRLQRPAR